MRKEAPHQHTDNLAFTVFIDKLPSEDTRVQTLTAASSSNLVQDVSTEVLDTYTTDEELVTLAAAGAAGAFDQLVGRWERQTCFLAYRIPDCQEQAREVTQEAFLRAFRGLKGFRGQSKFSSCVVPDRPAPLPGLVSAGAWRR